MDQPTQPLPQPAQSQSTTSTSQDPDHKQANKVLYISIAIIVILLVAFFTNGFGLFGNKKGPTGSVINNILPLEIKNSPILGDKNAPVTIYEFSDFSCPYCAAADNENPAVLNALKNNDPNWQAPIPLIIENYVKTGKAKLVFKYYPGHGAGKSAMVVGYALADQSSDLFWKFHDLAFANQQDTGDLVKMKALAQQLGANMTQLESDISSNKYDARLQDDIDMATSNNVKATPTFIINNKIVEGAQSFSAFQKVIDREL